MFRFWQFVPRHLILEVLLLDGGFNRLVIGNTYVVKVCETLLSWQKQEDDPMSGRCVYFAMGVGDSFAADIDVLWHLPSVNAIGSEVDGKRCLKSLSLLAACRPASRVPYESTRGRSSTAVLCLALLSAEMIQSSSYDHHHDGCLS